jgi:hypothetical protein
MSDLHHNKAIDKSEIRGGLCIPRQADRPIRKDTAKYEILTNFLNHQAYLAVCCSSYGINEDGCDLRVKRIAYKVSPYLEKMTSKKQRQISYEKTTAG